MSRSNLNNRLASVLGFLFFALLLSAGVLRTKVSSDPAESLLAVGSEKKQSYARFLSTFRSDYVIRIVWSGDVCGEDTWKIIGELETNLLRLESVESVSSLFSEGALYVRPADGGVEVDDFAAISFGNAEERCRVAESYDPYRSIYVSSDEQGRLLLSSLVTLSAELESWRAIHRIREILGSRLAGIECDRGNRGARGRGNNKCGAL